MDHTDVGEDQRMGNQDNGTSCSDSKDRKDEKRVEFHARTCNMARKRWIQMGLPFVYEVNCRKYVASHGIGHAFTNTPMQ